MDKPFGGSLAWSNNRILAAMIASRSPERARPPKRSLRRSSTSLSYRFWTPCRRPTNRRANRVCWQSCRRRRSSVTKWSKRRSVPSRGRCQDTAVGIRPHPRLDEVRHDGFRSGRGLRRCRRRYRAHYPASLTGDSSSRVRRCLRLVSPVKGKAPRGTWRFRPYREQRGGGPRSAGADIAPLWDIETSGRGVKLRTACWPN